MSQEHVVGKSNYLRRLPWLVIALLLLAWLVWGLRGSPVLVDVTVVQRGAMQVSIRDEGVTRVKDRYLVASPVSGYLQRIKARVGDDVDKGQVITYLEPVLPAVLDARDHERAKAQVGAAEVALLRAQEEVHSAQAQATLAEQTFVRQQTMDQEGFSAKANLEAALSEKIRASSTLRSALFSVDIAKYQLAQAETFLQHFVARSPNNEALNTVPVTSPVQGSVLTIHRQSEGVIAQGVPLIEVGDLSTLEVSVDVLSVDAVLIKPGMSVAIKDWGDQTLEGVVRRVEPVGFTKISALGVEEQRVWVIVDLVSPREQWVKLGDGYRVEAIFLIWQEEDVLTVPNTSLFRSQGQWMVYKIETNTVTAQAVEVGKRNGYVAQITGGLSEGDQVVSFPGETLKEGARIKPR